LLCGYDSIDFLTQYADYLIVAKSTDRLRTSLQINEVRGAPEAQVCIVCFAWTVYSTAHDGDGYSM
jgi:hypothetical protein